MVREIVKPTGNTYTLNLPDEMVGKLVEVIAFEIDKTKNVSAYTISNTSKDLHAIKRKYARYPLISHDSYEFNRNEVNGYE